MLKLQAAGVGLFLFIPVVLFLFVKHPEPVWASLVAGIVLMGGHKRIARPYWLRVRERKCIWCNRWLGDAAASGVVDRFEVLTRSEAAPFVACPGHTEPARRFFAWADRLRLPLRIGIGVPLVLLLGALAVAAFGRPSPLAEATELFRFAVGLTVNLGALGPMLGGPRRPEAPAVPAAPAAPAAPRAAFPLHNFSLLGVRAILWIFRLVGIWWIVAAGRFWIERLAG